ncbi:hypothetical protein [Azonexus sp. IMCC34839]|uniref:hypothetical protein n=1 Tax=Azonexus sp. IMCC34839 TaxID=3133695 RepID=UPI0039997D41
MGVIFWYFELFGRFGALGVEIGLMVLAFVVLVGGLFVRGALYDLGRLWRRYVARRSGANVD